MDPNLDAPPCGFQVNWPILLLMSRPRFFVATSVVSVMSQRLLFGRDLSLASLGSDVAIAKCCRDLNSLYLISRPLNVVATFWSLQQMSRLLNDVATSSLGNLCRDRFMMSRPLYDVATFSLLLMMS